MIIKKFLQVISLCFCLVILGCSSELKTDSALASSDPLTDSDTNPLPKDSSTESSEHPTEEPKSSDNGELDSKKEDEQTEPEQTEPKTADSSKKPAKKAVNGVYDLVFDDIKFELDDNINYDFGLVTDDIKAYEGKKIRLRGFMFPEAFVDDLPSFIFLRDGMECCYGPGSLIFDNMSVVMRKGTTAKFTPGRPITVEGIFHIKEEIFDDEVIGLYHIKDSTVKQ